MLVSHFYIDGYILKPTELLYLLAAAQSINKNVKTFHCFVYVCLFVIFSHQAYSLALIYRVGQLK